MVSARVNIKLPDGRSSEFLFTPSLKSQSLTCEAFMTEIGKTLALAPASLPLFAIHVGSLTYPKQILKSSGVVPKDQPICLLRCNFDPALERKCIVRDPNAAALLFEEVRKKVETGRVKVTDKQQLELESFNDPFFPTPRQYLEYLVDTCPEQYFSVTVDDCTISNDAFLPKLTPGASVRLTINREKLCFASDDGKEFSCKWHAVESWGASACNSDLFFNVFEEGCKKRLRLSSAQNIYITDTASLLCNQLAREKGLLEEGKSQLPGKPYDLLYHDVKNVLFSSGPKFSKF